ncbi:MAG: Tad domain-containing protein, partial [Chloroflexota bacterium]
MKRNNRSERGQALILIVFAIVALIGITALAVDGGNVYAERRRAQNAADSAALSAALAKVRGNNLYTNGLASAANNHYVDDDPTENADQVVDVEIYNPPIDYMGANDAYVGESEYIQVVITAEVKTYFGGIIGIKTVTNKVMAIARGKPPVITPIAFGNAIVGLSDGCKAIHAQGNGATVVFNGSLYANGENCNLGNAFNNDSGSGNLTLDGDQCVQGLGGVDTQIGFFSGCVLEYGDVSPLPDYVYPNPVCTGDTSVSGSTMSPGNWPPAGHTGNNDFPPAGVTDLNSGVYCINEGDFRVNASDTLNGTGVVIVINSGGVSLNGGATINLTAPTDGPFEGLLLFAPESNSCSMTL